MRPDDPAIKPQQASPLPGAIDLSPAAVDAGDGCVQCGLCLPACPTYVVTGDEGHAPRGRIRLMLGLHRGDVAPTDGVRDHLDACLNCRACETACPSGVTYHVLLEDARRKMHEAGLERTTAAGRGLRRFLNDVMTRPERLRLALLPARVLQALGLYGVVRRAIAPRLPWPVDRMERLLGAGPLWPRPLPPLTPPSAADRPAARVGFMQGCVGPALYGRANRCAVELLAACGAEVVTPTWAAVRCCGAIPHHNADEHQARELARRMVDAYADCDRVCTTIAGCGAMMREVGALLAGDPDYAGRAADFAGKVRDVSEVILELGPPPARHAVGRTVAHHAACHLHHAQRVTDAPRRLLALVPGLNVVEPAEHDLCCGAAGSYNLEHPEMADDLGRRKLAHLAATGADLVVTGNVGCASHIAAAARDAGRPLRVVHPVELLHEAVFGTAGD